MVAGYGRVIFGERKDILLEEIAFEEFQKLRRDIGLNYFNEENNACYAKIIKPLVFPDYYRLLLKVMNHGPITGIAVYYNGDYRTNFTKGRLRKTNLDKFAESIEGRKVKLNIKKIVNSRKTSYDYLVFKKLDNGLVSITASISREQLDYYSWKRRPSGIFTRCYAVLEGK